ncbi:adenylyltransferase/sulfurtransferase [Pedobacter psychrotolerans]|uniref:Molybdopterin-synthase adenylyltransferase n=1 Tax=Pedobacter psychrotolerans TaxID=1843235 RepID=A0A4R2HCQ8_9SPHI|nr:ThiF family adenylyltransferase [Pedobacter psychrotolerans]TCO25477.1 adenylyltransferase/sulfurtransferase [Pedobacter psychrotolerans]GGE45123.1 molybdopterin biosynthesis protein MoeZ [Pedobacter psychrotolerans]
MDNERYSRQLILKGFGATAQNKLINSRVLVVGAGGLGCPILQYLAAAGIGTIGIVDDDTISLSNLHRQIIFTTEDLDQPKVKVAAKRLGLVSPEISIVEHQLRLDKNNIFNIIESYDVVIDGTDNFDSRYIINDACTFLQKPLIFAAVSGFEGQLAIFNVKDKQGVATNYRDIFPTPPAPGEIQNCAENGVLGVLPGIIGTMAAAETIKLIAGIGQPLINTLLHYNLLTQTQYTLNISVGHDYVLPKSKADFILMDENQSHSNAPIYEEIDIKRMLLLREQDLALVIDVREKHEFPILDQDKFLQVPMSEFNTFIQNNIEAESIVLLCQHGIRSIAAAELLQEKYGAAKKIYSLKGGIAKWKDHFLKR